MDISGVEIGPDVRLLLPEDGGPPRLFHRVEADDWCETVLDPDWLTGSFDAANVMSADLIECSGGHVSGWVNAGQWVRFMAPDEEPEEPTDG